MGNIRNNGEQLQIPAKNTGGLFQELDMENRLNLIQLKQIIDRFRAEDTKFTSLSKFQGRSPHPSETPQKYLYELKKPIVSYQTNILSVLRFY